MPSQQDQSNIPSSDRLLDIRDAIKRLKEEEAQLRRYLIDNPDQRRGLRTEALVKQGQSSVIDQRRLSHERPDIVRSFSREIVYDYVWLLPLSEPLAEEVMTGRPPQMH